MMRSSEFRHEMKNQFHELATRIIMSLDSWNLESLPGEIISQIDDVRSRYRAVREQVIPRIETITQHPFSHPDLFFIVFFYREISGISNQVNQLILQGKAQIHLPPDALHEMIHVKDTMETLAFIGDGVIESGVFRSIWPQNGSIPKKGTLNREKEFIADGTRQAALWDLLVPEEQRGTTENPAKSSQFEAVFGIIYLEGGPEAAENAILALKTHLEKNFPE